MNNKISVEGHSNLYRDAISGAIINDSDSEYKKFMLQYESKQKTKTKLTSIEKDLSNLKSDIEQIKTLLLKLNERTSTD